jgi:hypothetical protein
MISGFITVLALLIVTPDKRAKPAEVSGQHQPPARQTAPQPNATGPVEEIHAKKPEVSSGTETNSGSTAASPPTDPWPNRFQAVTAAATALYFVATVFIFCEMWRFNRRALLLSLASNRETKKAADAAKSSADTAKRALETGERADVLVEAIDLIDAGYDRQRHSRLRGDSICRVTLKNYGRTRTEGLTVEYAMVAKHIEPSVEPDRIYPAGIPLVLGAGQPFPWQFPSFRSLGFVEADISEINNDSRRRLFVECKLEYDDVFSRHHSVTGTGLYDSGSGEFRLTHYETDQTSSG